MRMYSGTWNGLKLCYIHRWLKKFSNIGLRLVDDILDAISQAASSNIVRSKKYKKSDSWLMKVKPYKNKVNKK